ncbi:hypothetical protein C8F04DRAFT_1068911 [Mycena alexandri]|uniref:Uncharacterized protein n=1 Tax=Mycena alexandri TaxID=1745969 RepID=A0AAD6TIR4_9AGAR|nr:hypothetical protein C8F04DRAFT_1068911 [Mycena alexandri]
MLRFSRGISERNSRNILPPNLTSLWLMSSSTDLPKNFTTPRLDQLWVKNSFALFNRSFLRRSACSLTRLSLHRAAIPWDRDNELVNVLELLSDLEALEICCYKMSDVFLIALHSPKTALCLVLKLQQMTLSDLVSSSSLAYWNPVGTMTKGMCCVVLG